MPNTPTRRSTPRLRPEVRAKGPQLVSWLKYRAPYDNPVTADVICDHFEISELQLRLLTHYLRGLADRTMSCVGSDNRGYYYIANWSQAQDTLAQLRGRIDSLNDAVVGLCKAFGESDVQPELRL